MKTTDLANSFDRVLSLVETWGKNRSDSTLNTARKVLDEMHRLKEHPELSPAQLRVLEAMTQELSGVVEMCENWCPGDRDLNLGAVDITVNGVTHPMAANVRLSHLNISMLAYGDKDEEYTKALTCCYHTKGGPEGELYRGGPSVLPKEGMHFTIVHTGNA